MNDDRAVDPASVDGPASDARRVRVPVFPLYSHARALLEVLDGKQRATYSALESQLKDLRGTPQANVDWSDPDEWIDARLEGDAVALAHEIWTRSAHQLNPRYTRGSWYLLRTYGLIRNAGAVLEVTPAGRDFLANGAGDTVRSIDRGEGVLELLSIVAEKGPARRGLLIPEWTDYLRAYSAFGSESTITDTLARRLRDLLERELVERSGAQYQVTDDGLRYLEELGPDSSVQSGKSTEQTEIFRLTRRHQQGVRDSLLAHLEGIDPFAFEHLVRRLLEELGYQNVEVTAPAGDKGVDVLGDIELGITKVREVVQVKRRHGNVQRTVLDQLRGSLHRFGAIRGTIITTGGFSRGAREAAFEPGAAPITLIDGKKLVDLLIENELGVKRRSIDIMELDTEALSTDEERESSSSDSVGDLAP